MILDQLPQASRYFSVLPGLEQAAAFLATLRTGTADGRYEIAGMDSYCLVQRYRTRALADCKFEAHRRYADVQCLLAGSETILWAPLAALPVVTMPYDAERDVAFFANPPVSTPVNLVPGVFAVLLPADGHAPCVATGASSEVVKAVVKVRVG